MLEQCKNCKKKKAETKTVIIICPITKIPAENLNYCPEDKKGNDGVYYDILKNIYWRTYEY